jgi:glycosyltransferase involved in cell wall biosynthesis
VAPALKRRILFLMNRWLSTAGGIQTVNRKLACAMAALDDAVECIAIVMTATDEEVADAAQNGVKLLWGKSDEDWTSVLLLKDVRDIDPLTVAAVVGHSYFSGQQALNLRNNLFPAAKAVQFVHMSPMHTESLKEYRRDRYIAERERKISLELTLARSADIVACIGPRLHRYMSQQLIAAQAKPRVLRIDCGFERVNGERVIPQHPTILCMGRADSIAVKGLDIFAIAAGELTWQWLQHPATNTRPQPEFIVRGAKEESELLQEQLVKMSVRRDDISAKIHVRPYTTQADELIQDLRGASVFVMPSREEGFGLVACEALCLGVPVLISSESGLAETAQEMATRTGHDLSATIVRHVGNHEVFAVQYANHMLKILIDEKVAARHAIRMFENLLSTNSWQQAARTLRDALAEVIPAANSLQPIEPHTSLFSVDGSITERETNPTTGGVGSEASATTEEDYGDVTESTQDSPVEVRRTWPQWLENAIQRCHTEAIESPSTKLIISMLAIILTGILCGALAVRVSTPSGVQWRLALSMPVLYVLLGLVSAIGLYYRALYLHESAVTKFSNDDYCKAYMRSQCLPEAVERYKKLIRSGEVGELERAMAEFQRVLK